MNEVAKRIYPPSDDVPTLFADCKAAQSEIERLTTEGKVMREALGWIENLTDRKING